MAGALSVTIFRSSSSSSRGCFGFLPMASSDHLTASFVDHPWILRPTSFVDPWFADAFSHDANALTRALQMSLSSPSAYSNSNTTNTSSSDASLSFTPDVASSFLIPTPGLNTPGFGSGSFVIEKAPQAETAGCTAAPAPKPRQRSGWVASGKVAKKRKSRATKRSQTTFITADPASFRQMVQQVTGSGLGHSPVINIGQFLLPEPHRPGGRLPVISNNSSISSLAAAECLPTLDTSAFLLESHHSPDHQQQVAGQRSVDPVATPQPGALTDDFGPFGSFPTLESWIYM